MQRYNVIYNFFIYVVLHGIVLCNSPASWDSEMQEVFARYKIVVDTNVLRQAAIEAMARLIDPSARIINEEIFSTEEPKKEPDVKICELDKGICYIKLDAVSSGVYNELSKQLGNQDTDNIWGIVLDLRGSGGENFTELKNIAGLLLGPSNELYRVEDLQGNVLVTNYSEGTCGFHYSPTIIVLVNEQTSGSSELLTAVLKQRERTLVIGKRTKGNVTMQEIIELPGNIKLLMCIKRIKLKNGIILSDSIDPDIPYQVISEGMAECKEKFTRDTILKQDKGVIFAFQVMHSLRALNLNGLK
jgi:C-terminal processing protease CtpA/Prc